MKARWRCLSFFVLDLFVCFFGVLSFFLIFIYAPIERTMGAVQKIFYFHVGSALACYFSVLVLFISSIGYLKTRKCIYHFINNAACEVGLLFCTYVLISGMIWGNAVWNTFYRWEPRLVSFLFLWFLFLSMNTIRLFGDKNLTAFHSSILGIISAITVPFVILSVKLLPASHQLHPIGVTSRGLKEAYYVEAFASSVIALILLSANLILLATIISNIERQVSEKENENTT